jgi:hypothetical protein
MIFMSSFALSYRIIGSTGFIGLTSTDISSGFSDLSD